MKATASVLLASRIAASSRGVVAFPFRTVAPLQSRRSRVDAGALQASHNNPRRGSASLNKVLQMTARVSDMEPVDLTQRLKNDNPKATNTEEVPKTLPDALRVFFLSPGPCLVSIILLCLVCWRTLMLGPISIMDGLVFFGSVVFWIFQEHFLHGQLLHSNFDWYGKTVHQEHHEKPYFHVSIDPVGLMLAWLGATHLIFRWMLPLPIAISCTLGYSSAGLFYEWAHYIVHTKVKPRSSYMKKMRDNHIRHHCVDHRYWLAFSVPAIDDIFDTNPDVQEIRRLNKKREKTQELTS